MKQTNLLDLEFDEENEVGITKVDVWIKLQEGDELIGVYADKYLDHTYDKMKYFFSNATILRLKGKNEGTFNKIGLNSSGNIDFKLNNDDLLGVPLKIRRIKDKPIEGKPNPAHQFQVFQVKQKGGK